MAALEKDPIGADNGTDAGSPDPETLYTKEYCIGSSHACFLHPGWAHVAGKEQQELVGHLVVRSTALTFGVSF